MSKISIDGLERDNVWLCIMLGQLIRGDGGQEETVQRHLDAMQRKFYEFKPALTNEDILLG